jgi:hypothetical protein
VAAGFQPTQQTLNQAAGQIIISLRANMQSVQQFNSYLQVLGTSGLQALGYTLEDANLLISVFSNLDSIRNMSEGNPYSGPALPYNFVEQTVPLWGGQ